ncbi:extracellular solute-binding protein [Candidatus Protofrankia californiensis]|uniref:extracellular solute-binding protein n=1 Tax=Candidatus Protofrankia californiensis TaxID=1839754 RepID=UPI0010416CFF|nr:extracellular solute-binding protein [Candidatus Protofrankia californiensis]
MIRIPPATRFAVAAAVFTITACGVGGSNSPSSKSSLRPPARPATVAVDDANGATASIQCATKVKALRMIASGPLADTARVGKVRMEKAHPGLTVEITSTATTYSQIVQQIGANASIGHSTDLAVAGLDLLATFVQQLDAQELSPRSLRASYDQRFAALGKVGSQLFVVPQQVSVPVLLYNAEMLAQAGVDPASLKSTTGVLAAAEKIKKVLPGVQPIDLPTGDQFGQWFFNTIAGSKGANIQNAGGRPDFTSAAARDTASFLARVGSYGPQSNTPADAMVRFGFSRQSAIVGASISSVVPGLQAIERRSKGMFPLGVAPIPVLPGGTPHPVVGGNGLVVLATDRCQNEMATELMMSLFAPDVVAAGVKALSYLPVDTEAANQLVALYRQYPQVVPFNALIDSLARAPYWSGPRGGEVPILASEAVARIMLGADPVSTLTELQSQAETLVM